MSTSKANGSLGSVITSEAMNTGSVDLQCAGVPTDLMQSINDYAPIQHSDTDCGSFLIHQGDLNKDGSPATVVIFNLKGTCGPALSRNDQSSGSCGNHPEQYLVA